MTRYSRNFTTTDFPEGVPDSRLVNGLQVARNYISKPIRISSGGRSRKRNKAIGGAKHSSHIIDRDGVFLGCDIKCANNEYRHRLLKALFISGFERIFIYDRHVHVDVDYDKPYPRTLLGISK